MPDLTTILCEVMLFMCLILSFPGIIGCIFLIIVGDWVERILYSMVAVVLIVAVVVIWKVLGF